MTPGIDKRYMYSYDVIRIIAVFLVIFTHTGEIGSKIYTAGGVLNSNTIGYIGLDVLRMVNVPLFFMVSGALLLGKQESYKNMLLNRVLKYSITLCAAAFLYFFVVYKHPWREIGTLLKGIYQNDNSVVHFHLWFLYAYIGYLVILPFLRKMVSQMTISDFRYYLILAFLFVGVEQILNAFGLGAFAVSFVFGYDMIFYPIFGYCISHLLSKEYYNKKNLLIGILGSVVSIVITAYMIVFDFYQTGVWSEKYLDLFTFIVAGTIFYSIKYIEHKVELSEKWCKFLAFSGRNVFGIYIFSEMFFPIVLERVYDPLSLYLPTLLACAIMIIANMVMGLVLTTILKCIPIVRNLL